MNCVVVDMFAKPVKVVFSGSYTDCLNWIERQIDADPFRYTIQDEIRNNKADTGRDGRAAAGTDNVFVFL